VNLIARRFQRNEDIVKTVNVLAFDLGASNGRAIIGHFNGEKITTEEVHRFPNNYVMINERPHWDFDNLSENLKQGFRKSDNTAVSFGIDSWGVDYGLLDKEGNLISNPRSYRGSTDLPTQDLWEIIGKRELFDRSGIAFLNFNTVYQLFERVQEADRCLDKAETLLMLPDLLAYFFTGDKMSEYTNVTSSNLFNVETRNWDFEVIKKLKIPHKIFTEIDYPGHIRSKIKPELAGELNIDRIPLIAVGTHDTASAVAAIPLKEDYAFCSSGTWSLCGIETDSAVVSDLVYDLNLSNEGTVQGGCRPLKNIMGMWIIQECHRQWGQDYSWGQITYEAEKAKPFQSLINPNDNLFFSGGQMIERIQQYCEDTNQPIPQSIGEIARAIYESLALKYTIVLESLSEIKGKQIKGLNITGGGIRNRFLNQLIADSLGLPVVTGPIEGAALGNIIVQLIGLGEIKDISEGRSIIANSVEMQTYEPNHTSEWDEAYHRMLEILKQ
jgi:rhamnulokinase